MLHDSHVLDLESLLINWNTDNINTALCLEKDYAEYAAEHQAIIDYNIELYNNHNYYIFKAVKELMSYNSSLVSEVNSNINAIKF